MSNPFFNALGGMMNPLGRFGDIIGQARQFMNGYRGNAQEEVQKMVQNGQVNQQQYNSAVQMANQLYRMMGGK